MADVYSNPSQDIENSKNNLEKVAFNSQNQIDYDRIRREQQPSPSDSRGDLFPGNGTNTTIDVNGKQVEIFQNKGPEIDGEIFLGSTRTPHGEVVVTRTSAKLGPNNGVGTPYHGHLDFKNNERRYGSLAEALGDRKWMETTTEAFTATVKAYERMGYTVRMTSGNFDADADLSTRIEQLRRGFRAHEHGRGRRYTGRERVDFMVYDKNGNVTDAPVLVPALEGSTINTQNSSGVGTRNDFGIFSTAHGSTLTTRSGHGDRNSGYNTTPIAVGSYPEIDPQEVLNLVATGELKPPSLGDTSPAIALLQRQINWIAKESENTQLVNSIKSIAPDGLAVTGEYNEELQKIAEEINTQYGVPEELRQSGELGAAFMNILNASIQQIHSTPEKFYASEGVQELIAVGDLPEEQPITFDATQILEQADNLPEETAIKSSSTTEDFYSTLDSIANGQSETIGFGVPPKDFDLTAFRESLIKLAEDRGLESPFLDELSEQPGNIFSLVDKTTLREIQESFPELTPTGALDKETAETLLRELR